MREQDIEQRDQRAPQHGGRQDGGMTEEAMVAVRLAQSGSLRQMPVIASEAKQSSLPSTVMDCFASGSQ